jgi:uncharacterized protein YciI
MSLPSLFFGCLALGSVALAVATHESASSKPQPKAIFALVWHQSGSDEEFQQRIPRLMVWLKELHAKGHLVGCGGGEWKDSIGAGLTLITASSRAEAEKFASGTPMNEIGHTDIMEWECFYGKLSVLERETMLK